MVYNSTTKYNLSYYGADYTVDTIIHKMEEGEIIIPHFQREYVWKHNEASRFIESLILRLPVPSIFLLRDKNTNRLIIIDGQQRLKTLLYFFRGEFPNGTKFDLRNVIPEYDKKTYNILNVSDQRELKNSIIHSIIIMDEEDSDAPYHLFERLNTTGTPLTSQEIRSALYFGEFNDLIIELSYNEKWNEIIKKDNRLTDQEYILRLIALHYDLKSYNGHMNSFLNQFMIMNRNLNHFSKNDVFDFFIPAVELFSGIYPVKGRAFSIAFFEPIFYCFSNSRRFELDKMSVLEIVKKLDCNINYQKLTKSSTTSKASIFQKFELVRSLF